MTYSHFDYRFSAAMHRIAAEARPEQTPAEARQKNKPLNRKSAAKKRWWAEKKAREADDGNT